MLNKTSNTLIADDSVKLKLDLALKRLEQIAENKINLHINSDSLNKELELARKTIGRFEKKNSEINIKLNHAIQSVRNILED